MGKTEKFVQTAILCTTFSVSFATAQRFTYTAFLKMEASDVFLTPISRQEEDKRQLGVQDAVANLMGNFGSVTSRTPQSGSSHIRAIHKEL